MITASREAIYAAAFALAQGVATFKVSSRRFRHWGTMAATDQPALFMTQGREVPQQSRGKPAVWTMHADLWVYANAGNDESVIVSSLLNPIIDAIEAAFVPASAGVSGNAQTLGGLVSHCWIDGEVEYFEGVLGDQAVVIVPIGALAI